MMPHSINQPYRRLLVIVLLVTGVTTGWAQDTAAVSVEEAKAAQDAADAWVTLIDDLDYAESWRQAAPALQEQTSETAWVQQLQSEQGTLGPLVSRVPQDRTPTATLPDAPVGEYVVITYASVYTQLEDAIETVTMVKADDGTWRPLSYEVQPGS